MVGFNNLESDYDFESLVSKSFSKKGLSVPILIGFVTIGSMTGFSYEIISI